MAEMNLGLRCKYSIECSIYKGDEKINDNPLYITKNVFCNRGKRGWTNCKRYKQYQKQEEEGNN